MDSHLAVMLSNFADASAAGQAMKTFVAPVFATLVALASLACVFFLINGGIAYMTSSGRPDKLDPVGIFSGSIRLARPRPPTSRRNAASAPIRIRAGRSSASAAERD